MLHFLVRGEAPSRVVVRQTSRGHVAVATCTTRATACA